MSYFFSLESGRRTPVKFIGVLILTVLVLVVSAGCTILKESGKNREARLKRIERRRQVQRLEQALTGRVLSKGVSCRDILERYGDPDDIFLSGGGQGRFALYTYEHIPDDLSDEPDWNPIRLYCQDDRLIDWRL